MRKLFLVLAVVFAASLYTAAGVSAATCPTKKKVKHHIVAKHKVAKASSKLTCKPKMTMKKKSMPARIARGPACKAVKHTYYKMTCKPKMRTKRASRPARLARGPSVTCPAPVVNVPQQAAPVVNVPQGPAPVVNVPPSPPTVGITVDNCNIYIVRENQLMILDKNTYQVKSTVPLQ